MSDRDETEPDVVHAGKHLRSTQHGDLSLPGGGLNSRGGLDPDPEDQDAEGLGT